MTIDHTKFDNLPDFIAAINGPEGPGLTDDLAHWAGYKVYTPAELDTYLFWCDFHDLHKSAYGFRPRGRYTREQAEKMWEGICDYLSLQAAEEAEEAQWEARYGESERRWAEFTNFEVAA